MVFTEATREQLLLRLAIVAVSGGGKTYSALGLATCLLAAMHGVAPGPAMAREIAVIDSERGSSRRYARGRPWHFSVLELTSFAPERYVEAIHAAEKQGFRVVIIDSLSHEWAGTDGCLEQKDRAGVNSFTAWGKITPRHNAVIDAIMGSSAHVIGTMRAKQFYEQTTTENGKKEVKPLGLGAVQRDGIEYEFDIVLDMDLDNTASVRKTRCTALRGRVFREPGEALARELAAWLADGEPRAEALGDAPSQGEDPAWAALAQHALQQIREAGDGELVARAMDGATPLPPPLRADVLIAGYARLFDLAPDAASCGRIGASIRRDIEEGRLLKVVAIERLLPLQQARQAALRAEQGTGA